MSITINRSVIDRMIDNLDPDKAYGGWGDDARSVACDDDDNPTVRLVLKVRPDDSASINDFDCYGRIEWGRSNGNGYHHRPDGFDGNATTIDTRDGRLWWQPSLFDKADRRRWAADPQWRRAMHSQVLDIIEFGFNCMSVSIDIKCECCDQWKTVGGDGLAGTEPTSLTDARYYVADVASEAIAAAAEHLHLTVIDDTTEADQ